MKSVRPGIVAAGATIRAVVSLGIGSALLIGSVAGCSRFGSQLSPTRYEEAFGTFAGKIVERSVSRAALDKAVSRGENFNSLRMVEVFRRGDDGLQSNAPQYRLFDIQKGSVYELLGLENGDVLLAASGYLVFEAAGFRTYATVVLRTAKEGDAHELFVSRAGVPLRLRNVMRP